MCTVHTNTSHRFQQQQWTKAVGKKKKIRKIKKGDRVRGKYVIYQQRTGTHTQHDVVTLR